MKFDDIDFSKYKHQIEKIEKDYNVLMSNKKFLRKFSKFKKKYEKQELKKYLEERLKEK